MREECIKRFLSHIFGAASSSFITTFVIRFLADRLKGTYPADVIDTMRRKSYVDDLHGGNNNLKKAVTLKQNLNEAMAVGGLPLGKWKANHEDLLHHEPGEPKPKLEEGYTKVLGVHWCPKRDQFAFKVDMSKLALPARTPRQLVSVQCSLYDPNGFVSPFIFL